MASSFNITNFESLLEIQGTDCIGDSRAVINNNILELGTAVSNLSTQFNINNISSRTTLGTLVSSLSVFDTTGTYLGYIPLYK